MGTFDTFSKRQKRRQREGQPILYVYDDLPEPFRVQVRHILDDVLGEYSRAVGRRYERSITAHLWDHIYRLAIREFGVMSLVPSATNLDRCDECLWYLQNGADVERVLDLIDLAFHVIDGPFRQIDAEQRQDAGLIDADEAIAELNHRFREHDLGYQFANGELIRVDSEYLYAEAIEPALALLHAHGFGGAEDEFLGAHRHFRKGEYRDAIMDANNAFESTMKSICDIWCWVYEPTASAKTLISIMLKGGLIPNYLQDSLNGLQNLLLGLPTLRNKTSGHGQGINTVEIPEYMAAYALHLAASNIVMLVAAHEANYMPLF